MTDMKASQSVLRCSVVEQGRSALFRAMALFETSCQRLQNRIQTKKTYKTCLFALCKLHDRRVSTTLSHADVSHAPHDVLRTCAACTQHHSALCAYAMYLHKIRATVLLIIAILKSD